MLAVDVADKPETVTEFLTTKRLTGLHVALTKAFPDDMPQNYACSAESVGRRR